MQEDIEDTLALGSPHPARLAPPPRAMLVCINPGSFKGPVQREIRLDGRETTVGRGAENSVVLDLDGVSRTHARLIPGDGTWGVEDLNSKNGVRVNKAPVRKQWLEPGDIVSIAKVHYKYALDKDGPVATSAHRIDLRDTDETMLVSGAVQARLASEAGAGRMNRRGAARMRVPAWAWAALVVAATVAVLVVS